MKATVLACSGPFTNVVLFVVHSFGEGLMKTYDVPRTIRGAEGTGPALGVGPLMGKREVVECPLRVARDMCWKSGMYLELF